MCASDIRPAYINSAATEVKQFWDALCQSAAGAVTLRFMRLGQTLRLRLSTVNRSAFAGVADTRALRSLVRAQNGAQRSPQLSAKAKKQPLI